jgi:hypothetical protein
VTTLFASILATALLARSPGETIQGKVVDDQGKPVAGAQVLFQAPAAWGVKPGPVEVRTQTDADGRFRLTTPPLRHVDIDLTRVWLSHAGRALARVPHSEELTRVIVLHRRVAKTIKIEGPDGRPEFGARIAPRVIWFRNEEAACWMPDSLAESRTVTTGREGRATIDDLPGPSKLLAVRVTAESIGTQDLLINDDHGDVTLRLKPTSRLSGRVRARAGEPAVGQTIEVWTMPRYLLERAYWLESNPVAFTNGPLKTAGDGSFETPDNLLVGSLYRVVVRAAGQQPILSDAITIENKLRVLLPMIQRPLRIISGRVVDRRGKPVAGIEVFQSGDGPERTTTKTDADGRFSLGGFCQGPVCLFARGEGFRFFGRLVKPGDGDVAIEMTRLSERPLRDMRMLPTPIPLEESRALAKRLIEPYWQAFRQKRSGDEFLALRSLVRVDPVGVLLNVEGVQSPIVRADGGLEAQAAIVMARMDPDKAERVAEAIDAPFSQATALIGVVDTLRGGSRQHKLALLEKAAVQAKASANPLNRLWPMVEVGERWWELGEREKAQAIFAEALRLAKESTKEGNPLRKTIAVPLARVDLPSALAIAKEVPAVGLARSESEASPLVNIAWCLAADSPAEAERVLGMVPQHAGRDRFHPAIAWRMAAADPERAWRLTDQAQQHLDQPQRFLFLALGLKSRDPAAAERAFRAAMQGMDRLMKDSEYCNALGARQVLLPMVEEIDPALVPEYFWRIVATRPNVGDPRFTGELSLAQLILLLGWYDRDVAAALLERVRAGIGLGDDSFPDVKSIVFLAWSIFDPRAAVARLEQEPFNPKLPLNQDRARQRVAEALTLGHEERWRNIWLNFTEMENILRCKLVIDGRLP